MSATFWKKRNRRRVPALEPRQLVHDRLQRPLDVGGGEDRQGVVQLGGDAPVVDHQSVVLVVGAAVHAGDRLEEAVLPQRRVEVHDLLDRGVEAGEQHVADDQDRERVTALLEALHQPVLLLAGEMPVGEALGVVVLRRHDQRRLGGVQAVEGLLVGRGRIPAHRHHLGLEAVGLDIVAVVLEEVEADGLDPPRGAGDGLLGGVALLDRGAFLLGAVGEHGVEDLVDALADDLQVREPRLVEDRHRGVVGHRLLDRVGVDVGAEGAERALVALVDGRAGEAQEAGVGECPAHVGGQGAVLGAVRLVDHDEDVRGLGEDGMGFPLAACHCRRGRRSAPGTSGWWS